MKKTNTVTRQIYLPSGIKSDLYLSKRELRESVNLHTHAFFEFEIYLSGKGKVGVNNYETPISPGVAVLLAPTDYHKITVTEEGCLLNLSFSGNAVPKYILDKILAKSSDSYFTVSETDVTAICSFFDIILSNQSKEATYGDGFEDKCVEALLVLILRYVLPSVSTTKNVAVLKALSYIHSNIDEDLSLRSVAALVGLTPTYLSTSFKETTGYNYKNYILKVRISLAKRLIINNALSPTEACFAAGFNTYSSFLRAFKKITGITPVEYLKENNR